MIQLIKPKYHDLRFRQEILADSDTMSYNNKYGGTISFPEKNWNDWYDWWIVNPQNKFYRYIYDNDAKKFVGEVCYHFDDERECYICGIIVKDEFRGKGFGKEGLLALLDEAKQRGITEMYDDIAIDNPAINLFLHCGFNEEYQNEEYVMVKKAL